VIVVELNPLRAIQKEFPASTEDGNKITYFIKLSELVNNTSKVVGTLCFKSFVTIKTSKKEHQDYLISCSSKLLSNIDRIKTQEDFVYLIDQFNDNSLNVSISLLTVSEELKIKYSTDQNVVGCISSDQDQLSYDLGVIYFSEEKVPREDVPNIKIYTITVPISIRV
jgi:hypothetical protein